MELKYQNQSVMFLKLSVSSIMKEKILIQHDIIKLRDDARTSVSSKHVLQPFPEK